ncbi:MAG: ATPase [Clostridia bacterium]
MRTVHFFPGGNTAVGFYSCFEDILPLAERKRMFYLKGGPGVGKSTLMRRVGEAAEKAGLMVEYFHCSSDPESLDGVSLPEKGIAMIDGTAPHVYDPVVPGARDTLLSLGDFLDEAALRPHAREIMTVQSAISACFQRCYRYLAAARSVSEAGARGAENPQKARAAAFELSERMPLRGGVGSVRRLFASAYTPKGVVELPLGMKETLALECPFGLHATGFLHELALRAVARGLQAVELLNPLSPAEIDHLLLPAHGLAFTTCARAQAEGGEVLKMERVFDCAPSDEKALGFDRNAYELLVQRALEQLHAAKALHDELETFYVGNMDFLRWETMLQGVLVQAEI